MIPVTKPYLPSKDVFDNFVEGSWKRNWLTNSGPLVNELELKLKEHLSLSHLLYVSNGTIALQLALRSIADEGEVITTPFSYIATTSSILWERFTPVYADIDAATLNIDPAKIEEAITPDTVAILATHVFGNPCDIDAIDKIAARHNIKVIYDAAHCFGTTYKGKSVFDYGDISTVSFHATKLFHTIEGGAVITQSAELLKKISFMANFGHNGPVDYEEVGINAKNSEFHAAMGLSNLLEVEEILACRKRLSKHYDSRLKSDKITYQSIQKGTGYNYAYYPVIIDSEELLEQILEALKSHKIFPRRYFHPSLNTVGLSNHQDMSVSESISERVLCLPLYHTLSKEEIDLICRVILRTINYA